MKKSKFIIAAFMLMLFVLTSFIHPQNADDNKPLAVYQVGSSKVVVWENKRADGTSWKNFQVEKVYKKGEEWAASNSFDETELLQLQVAIGKAIDREVVVKR